MYSILAKVYQGLRERYICLQMVQWMSQRKLTKVEVADIVAGVAITMAVTLAADSVVGLKNQKWLRMSQRKLTKVEVADIVAGVAIAMAATLAADSVVGLLSSPK
ncbi:hypothetical protein C1H46_045502 [Malus baccata]|uniref:Uncharacterized protein n=1 Tax=Malus baccata TaxID=106549 RepID=A0A540K416_MALBA|nr:hypothetical protein C1H46_045502 [Malus baccata]